MKQVPKEFTLTILVLDLGKFEPWLIAGILIAIREELDVGKCYQYIHHILGSFLVKMTFYLL